MNSPTRALAFRRLAVKIAKAILLSGALLWLSWLILQGWENVRQYSWHIQPQLLALAFPAVLAYWFLNAACWNMALKVLGGELSLPRAIRIYFLSNLARYLPGGGLHALGRAYLGEREKVSAEIVSTSMVMEIALALTSAILVALLSLPLVLSHFGPKALVVGGGLALLGFGALHPRALNFQVGLFARLLRRKSRIQLVVRYSSTLAILAVYFVAWLAASFALFVLLNSLQPIPLSLLPAIGSLYAVSYVFGLLTPLAPAGLGAREGLFIVLVGQLLPMPVVTVAALLFRVWLTLAGLVWVAVAASYSR